MPFRVTVRLLEPSYQASRLDRGAAEWPPHPARAFCGLVSVADPSDPAQDAALRWLEEQPAPLVRVPAQTAEAVTPRQAWVPTNAVAKDPKHVVLPGRSNGGKPKSWPQRELAEPVLEFEWAAEPPPGVAAVLEVMAKSVPYIGRATGHALWFAEVGGTSVTDEEPDRWQVWEPAASGAEWSGAVGLRVAYPGYLAALRQAYADAQPSWQLARTAAYVLRGAGTEPVKEPVPGPYEDLVTFAFPSAVSLDPAATMAVTGALRNAVMSRLTEAGHDVANMRTVHGHRPPAEVPKDTAASPAKSGEAPRVVGDEVQRCAYLALPFVGARHADGRLRGVAVALPRGMDKEQRRAVLAVLLRMGGGLKELRGPGLKRPLALRYVGAGSERVEALWSVRPERWSAASRYWTTALPMVLDGFPKRGGRGIEALVAKSCRIAGLPEPAEVEVLNSGAYAAGGAQLPAAVVRRKPEERLWPVRHVRLRFAEPVTGPVLLGSKRSFGLGLCLPTKKWGDEEE